MPNQKPISVLFATAELTPLAKVGGLADVAGALPPVLLELGVDVRVVLPKYGTIDENKYPCRLLASDVTVPTGAGPEKVSIFETKIPGTEVIIYLIDNLKYLGQNGIYFDRTAFVESISEVHRFLFFSQALLSIPRALNWYPDIIHCQDWHVGIAPALLKLAGQKEPKLKTIKTLFTIHNLANQGKWKRAEALNFLGIAEKEFPGPGEPADINLIQQGIINSNLINTVSRTYAQEIVTPACGEGLEADLLKRQKDLSGIVNGLDQKRFNPETDPDIAANYSINAIEKKSLNKQALQELCGLPINSEVPVFSLISRLTDQKGIELVAECVPTIVENGGQLVFLGQGAENFEKMASSAQERFPKNVYAKIGFDAVLAQKIYAGSDMFLMPSRFEPCGLSQLIAMRYGTIPIVRATGGLKDTVADYDPKTRSGHGLVFADYSSQALREAIIRALRVFTTNKADWLMLVQRAMSYDSSWITAAREYLNLYQKLISQ
ncbi:MAG: glycogen/starch synthase [Patescibacteria group bacterium]|nr:glycogen/starch synthase [Patescibacteria group bacterium]